MDSMGHITTLHRNSNTKLLITTAAKELVSAKATLEPMYQFLDKKRAEGKPYFVYMNAAQNKSLCIYYARVKECLSAAGV